MSKANTLNLFLLIIIFGLASFVYFSENKKTEPGHLLNRLSAIETTSIKTITIQHNKKTTIINKQTDDHWVMHQPVNVDANTFRINSILKLINAPVHSHYTLVDIDEKTIGFEQPTTIISFDGHRIIFGITNPVTHLRYIKFDNKIYTIEDIYYPLISSNFAALVSLNLLPTNSKIDKLILINQTIAKDSNGLWQSNITISADHIAKTIDDWQTVQAFGIHEYLKREQLGDVFVYTNKQQQPVRYLITDIDPWLIMARPELGLEYHLDIEAYNKLITPQ